MAKADMTKLAGRDVTPVPEASAAPASAPEPAQRRRTGERTAAVAGGEPEEALGVDVPVSMKRELKSKSASNGEKMKHVVARAIRRELDRMQESQ